MKLFLLKKSIPCYSRCIPLFQTHKFSSRSLSWEVASNEYSNYENEAFKATGNKIEIMPIQVFKLSPMEQLKTEYLLSDPGFVKNLDLDVKVKFQLRDASLELSGVHSQLPIWEEVLQNELDKIHFINVEIPKQFGHLLSLNSADKLQNIVSNKVIVKQQPDSKNVYTIIGNSSSLDYFNQILNQKMDTILSKTFKVYKLYPSAEFPTISSKLDLIPDSCYTINGNYLNFWCLSPEGIQNTESIFDRYKSDLDFFKSLLNEDTKQKGIISESKLLTHSENELLSKLGYKMLPGVRHKLEPTFDGNKLQLTLAGPPHRVKTAMGQIRDMVSSSRKVYIDIPPDVHINSKHLNQACKFFDQPYSKVLMSLPGERSNTLSLNGHEMTVNHAIIYINNTCCNHLSQGTRELLLSQTPLQYTLQKEEAEEFLEMIKMKYPEVKVTHSSFGANETRIHVQGPLAELDCIHNHMASNVSVPISSNVDIADVVQFCKLLKTNGVIPEWVEVSSRHGKINLNYDRPRHQLREVRDKLRELVDYQCYRYQGYAADCRVVQGLGGFNKSLNAIAEEYNVFLNALEGESGVEVEIGGLRGSMELVKHSIRTHIASLRPVVLPQCENETVLLDHIAKRFQESNSFHLVYDNKCGVFRVGGTQEEIALFHELLKSTYQERIEFKNDKLFEFFCEKISRAQTNSKDDDPLSIDLIAESEDRHTAVVTGTERDVKIQIDSIDEKLRNLCYFEKTLNKDQFHVLRYSQLNDLYRRHLRDKYHLLIRETKQPNEQCLLQVSGPPERVTTYAEQLDKILDPTLGWDSRVIDLPYSGWFYFNCLQVHMGVDILHHRKPSFKLNDIFPEAMVMKNWNSASYSQNYIWKLKVLGEPSDVVAAEEQIKMAISNLPFRRIAYPVLSHSFIANIYNRSDLHKEICAADSKVYNYYTYDKGTALLDIWAAEPQVAEHYHHRILEYLEGECLFRTIDTADYTTDPAMLRNMRNAFRCCPIRNYVIDNADKIELNFKWSENKFLICGEKEAVTEVDTYLRDWVKNFTSGTREFEKDSVMSKFTHGTRYSGNYHKYCTHRWPLLFYRHQVGTVLELECSGHKDHIEDYFKYVDNFVQDEFPYNQRSEGGAALAKSMARIIKLYNLLGNCVIDDSANFTKYGHRVELLGERLDVEAVKDIFNHILEHEDTEGCNFYVMHKDRKVDIPFNIIQGILLNPTKLDKNWPNIKVYLVGKEIRLSGSPEQTAHFTDWMVRGRLVELPVPQHLSEHLMLSQYIPPKILDRLFMAEFGARSGKRQIFGLPEELADLQDYATNNLSHIRSHVLEIPVHMSNIMRSPDRGFSSLVKNGENTSYYVDYDKSSRVCRLYLAAPVDTIDGIVSDVEQFKSRYAYYIINKDREARRRLDEYGAYLAMHVNDKESGWNELWFFQHAIHWGNLRGRHCIAIMGDTDILAKFVETLKSRAKVRVFHDPMTEEFIDKSWNERR